MAAKRRGRPRRRGSAQRRSEGQRKDRSQTPSTPRVGGDSFRYDYYAFLAGLTESPELKSPSALATSWIVGTRSRPRRDTQQRDYYRNTISTDNHAAIIEELGLTKSPCPTIKGWFALDVDFRLQRPWYSKDDVYLQVLDNPVRKDPVFGAPFMAASSWKGLLRWACRMEDRLGDQLQDNGNSIEGRTDQEWIIQLFGNSTEKVDDGARGALAFRPSWFDKVGFELINPHSRYQDNKGGAKTQPGRSRTKPIIFEVVPPGASGTLQLLYAPVREYPIQHEETALRKLFSAIENLLTVYGFSAKRSSGWGMAEILGWRLRWGNESRELGSREEALDLMYIIRGWKGVR